MATHDGSIPSVKKGPPPWTGATTGRGFVL